MTTINTTGYTLVFDPSFSSLSLESSSNPNGTWDTAYWWDTAGSANFNGRTLDTNDEAEFYSDPSVGVNPFSVNNGVLTITAAPATASMLAIEAAANNGATLPYTSGLLTTYTSFAQTYGLYEITAKLPAGQGLWPAIWLLPTSGAWPPEIDVMEMIGSQPTGDNITLHTGANNTQLQTTVQVPTATTAFNTYAVDWEPNTVTFYVDGKQVFQEATPSDMHQPMYLLMNLAVGGAGSWPGAPNSSTVFPAQMQISSVEVYASPNTIPDYNIVGVQTPTPTYLPPVAEPDVFTGQENKPITGNLMANNGNGAATDPNGLALSVVAATLTTTHGGSVVENANGTFTYTPATGFFGNDSFTYTVEDSAGLTATATASITVYAPPVAEPDNLTGQENKPITGNLMANNGNGAATDPNGLALSVVAATLTTTHGGSVVENANGTFTYTPATGFFGNDSFTYTVEDSAGLTATATANITVNANIITGGSGNTTLSDGGASAGNYTLIGNSTDGGDTFIVNNTGDLVTEAHGGGAALVESSVSWALGANIGQLTLTGSANLTGTANAGNDVLTSNSGVDTLIGGSGADTFVVNNAQDVITETNGGGNTYILNSNHDTRTMSGYEDAAIANGNSDAITLNGWADTVTIAGGGDTVNFSGGSNSGAEDIIDTGTGKDTFNIETNYDSGNIAGSNSTINIDGYQDGVTVAGNNEAIELSGQGDKVTVSGTGDTVNLNGIAENVTDTGSSDTFNIANAYSTGTIAGSNNIVNISAYQDNLTVGSGETVTVTGWQDSLKITGSGDTINLSANSGAGDESISDTGTGHDTFNVAGSYATGTIAGSNSVINMSGYLDNLTVSGNSETINLSNWNETVTLSGSSEALNIKGAGADTFILTGAAAYSSHDALAGFSTAEGDVLNISSIISGYTPGASTLADFVQAVSNGSGGTLLQVDQTGSGSHFQTVVTLTGISGVDIATYIAHENLIV